MLKNRPASAGDARCRFCPWVWKIPWRREWQPTPVFLPGKSHRPRSLVGYSAWGCKESNMTEQLSNNLERRVVLFSFDVMSVTDIKEFNLKLLLVNI